MITVVKIGGSTLGNHDTTIEDIVELQRHGEQLVVVHGGGKIITDWLKKQGVPSQFVRGERVTDRATLEVVTAVLAGLVNKDIVADINARGGRAAGISGVDGPVIEGGVENKKMGYVGRVSKVNTFLIKTLTDSGFVPVIAPLGYNADKIQAGEPKTLNFNADIIAGEIAAAINANRLIFLTDVAGVLDSSGKVLAHLSQREAGVLIDSGVASGGMIPKIRACLKAMASAATTCIIDGREPHALIHEIRGATQGTTISPGKTRKGV